MDFTPLIYIKYMIYLFLYFPSVSTSSVNNIMETKLSENLKKDRRISSTRFSNERHIMNETDIDELIASKNLRDGSLLKIEKYGNYRPPPKSRRASDGNQNGQLNLSTFTRTEKIATKSLIVSRKDPLAPSPQSHNQSEVTDETVHPIRVNATENIHGWLSNATSTISLDKNQTDDQGLKSNKTMVSPDASHHPKPSVTTSNANIDDPIPVSPTIMITVITIPILIGLTSILYNRGRDCWEKRHYRRMDFLIDGMYND